MSLGGMAIAIGSLVDDAIVDVENVWKHLRENRALPPDKRLPVVDVVFNASKEVRMPILNSTLIIIVTLWMWYSTPPRRCVCRFSTRP